MKIKITNPVFLFAGAIIILILGIGDDVTIPFYPLIFTFLGFFLAASAYWWLAFKGQGPHVIANLNRERGGHSTYNSEDIRKPVITDEGSYQVMAVGGFDHKQLGCHGKKLFLVFPPEHMVKFGKNGILLLTMFENVRFYQLPRVVQDELLQLTHFKEKYAHDMNNIYFGLTSTELGTYSKENREHQDAFLAQCMIENKLLVGLKKLSLTEPVDDRNKQFKEDM